MRASDTPCHAVAAWVAQSVRGSNAARSNFFFSKSPDRHWAHLDSCGMGTGGRSTVVMRPEADKSPAPSNKDKDEWS